MGRRDISDATVFVNQGTHIPAWLENSGAEISLGHLKDVSPSSLGPGPRICQVVIRFAQVNFHERGSTIIRYSGSERFRRLFPPGVALGVTDREGRLVLNRHFCRVCYENTGWFARDSNHRKVILHKGKEETIYQFHCFRCGFRWEVPFPNSNGNGHNHGENKKAHRR